MISKLNRLSTSEIQRTCSMRAGVIGMSRHLKHRKAVHLHSYIQVAARIGIEESLRQATRNDISENQRVPTEAKQEGRTEGFLLLFSVGCLSSLQSSWSCFDRLGF